MKTFNCLFICLSLIGCALPPMLFEKGQTVYVKPGKTSETFKFRKCENVGIITGFTRVWLGGNPIKNTLNYSVSFKCYGDDTSFYVPQEDLSPCPQEPEKIEKIMQKCEQGENK